MYELHAKTDRTDCIWCPFYVLIPGGGSILGSRNGPDDWRLIVSNSFGNTLVSPVLYLSGIKYYRKRSHWLAVWSTSCLSHGGWRTVVYITCNILTVKKLLLSPSCICYVSGVQSCRANLKRGTKWGVIILVEYPFVNVYEKWKLKIAKVFLFFEWGWGIGIRTWISQPCTRFELRAELESPERSEFSGELCSLVIVS